MSRKNYRGGFGWVPDIPDLRDKKFSRAESNSKTGNKKARAGYSLEKGATSRAWLNSSNGLGKCLEALSKKPGNDKKEIQGRFQKALRRAFQGKNSQGRESLLLASPPAVDKLPEKVDLRPFMSPIENQGAIGSCTAHAVIGLVEYLQIATQAQYVDASRLFLYKVTRNLMHWEDADNGAYLRETIKAMRLFGACPEDYWPYDEANFNGEPSSFCYSFASNYQALCYYRLDNLTDIKRSLAQGYPVAFGFSCFESLDAEEVTETGYIPYPKWHERNTGAHAVLAVGYIDSSASSSKEFEKCLLIRNSWSTDWGQDGYGFLPYEYIQGYSKDPDKHPSLSEDYWTITRAEMAELSDARVAPFLIS